MKSLVRFVPKNYQMKYFKKRFQERRRPFLFAMGDGGYIQEMMDTSIKMFNTSETLEAYGMMR